MTASREQSATFGIAESDAVCGLLRRYHETLRRAEQLPWVLWTRTRTAGSSTFARWWGVPRLTIGASLMVRYHIARSVTRLIQAYAAKAALEELDERGQEVRKRLTDFHNSFRPINLRYFVIAAAAIMILVGQAVTDSVIGSLLPLLSDLLGRSPLGQANVVKDILKAVPAILSMSASSTEETVRTLMRAHISDLFFLVVILLMAAYFVLRPWVAAFRIKRMLFNLADEPAEAIFRTASTWHGPRSTGLYAQEKDVFDLVGARVNSEKPIDLLLSALMATFVGCFFAAIYVTDKDPSTSLAGRVSLTVLVIGLLSARLAWIMGTYNGRRSLCGLWQIPTAAVLPVSCRVVDVRPATEASFAALLLPAPVIWYRLSRQFYDLRTEVRAKEL